MEVGHAKGVLIDIEMHRRLCVYNMQRQKAMNFYFKMTKMAEGVRDKIC